MSDTNKNGKIKFFNNSKGFGFITDDKGDVFFHINDCENIDENLLTEGAAVSFGVEKDKFNRLKAINVSIAE